MQETKHFLLINEGVDVVLIRMFVVVVVFVVVLVVVPLMD